MEIFQDILKILARKVKVCDLQLYEKLLQRSPITKEMSENGIVKSAAELKAEIKNFKIKNTPSKLIDDITDNLMSQVKNIQLHMVYLHNNMDVKGIPRYEIKLNNIKLSVLDEKYINGRFKNLRHSKDETQSNTTNKAIKTIMLIHKKANLTENKSNSIPEDKAINMTKISSQLVRLEAAPCVQLKSKFLPFLLDSGSDSNLLSYNSFTSIGFKSKYLDTSVKYNIKSSQGYQEDVVMGTFTTKLVLKNSKGIPVLTNLIEFMVTKPHYFLKENILGTPFFANCKVSLSWATGNPTVKGTVYENNLFNRDPYETGFQLLEYPTITNINVIKLQPQTTTLLQINIRQPNLDTRDMTLKIYDNENEEYISTALDTKVKGKDIVIGNMWNNDGVKPTLRSNKEICTQAHITNRSGNIIELDRHSIKIKYRAHL